MSLLTTYFPMVPTAGLVLLSLHGRDGSVPSLHPSSHSTRQSLSHLSASLIPVTSSPSCPHHHNVPILTPLPQPQFTPTHLISPLPQPHFVPSFRQHFTPVVHNHLSAHFVCQLSSALSPSPHLSHQPHVVIIIPTPSHPVTSAPHSPCSHSLTPIHPRSPQPHTALTPSAPSCHLSLPTQFIPTSAPLPQLYHLISSVPSLCRPLSPSLPTITLTPILASPRLPPSCPHNPGPTSRPFPARLTAPLTHSLSPPPNPPPPASRRSAKAPANSQPRPPLSTIG